MSAVRRPSGRAAGEAGDIEVRRSPSLFSEGDEQRDRYRRAARRGDVASGYRLALLLPADGNEYEAVPHLVAPPLPTLDTVKE